MMDERKLVPKKRFKGFDKCWTPDILDNLLDVNSGQDYKHLEKGDVPVYGTGGYMLSVNDKLSSFDGVGIGRKGTIDKPVYLKAPYWTVDTLFYMLPKEEINIHFLYYLSKNINWKNYDESTGVPSLSRNTINNIRVFITNLKEQQKIGEFFKVLDDRIANQERKIAKVKALKEAYLTEMFPQEGETLPKRRFKGFEGEWVSENLGDILNYEQPTDYIVTSDQYSKGYPIPVLTAGQSFVLGFTNEKYGVKEANENNPVIIFDDFTTSSHFVNFPFKVKSSALKILSAKTEKSLPYFSYLILKNIKYEPENHERHWISIYSLFHVLLPSINEQQKIGSFFKNLDDQIRVEEAKLEKLKKMKEAYLEEMFV